VLKASDISQLIYRIIKKYQNCHLQITLTMQNDPTTELQSHRETILHLLQKHQLVEGMVRKQDMPHHDLVESLVRKQNLVKLKQALNEAAPSELARILEELSPEDLPLRLGSTGGKPQGISSA
jgi:hypothetical protein